MPETTALTDGICELTLEVRDRDRMECFYTQAFGMATLAREEDRTWLAAGPCARLGLWLPGEKEFGDEGGVHVHFALSASRGRLEEIAERVRTAGGRVHGPVEHDGGDRSLYTEDPEGNVVEVWDYFESGEGADEGVRGLAGE